MQTVVHLTLALCTLHLLTDSPTSADASTRPWKSRDYSVALKRRIRAANKPIPINCQLGTWSSWTECNSCTDRKFRFRFLERPSQFSGTPCSGTLWEWLSCPAATSQCLVEDNCGDSFTCSASGRCIPQSLRCNSNIDCNDNSDEEGCQRINARDDRCSNLMLIPGAERGTQGYNILTEEFVEYVLDPKYFGGECEYVYNGEWRKYVYDTFCESLRYNDEEKNYRKPYNYNTYQFLAHAQSEASQEYYEDMTSLLRARKSLSSFNLGFTVSVNFVEGGLNGSKESEFFTRLTQYQSQDLGFIRLTSKVQTARFKMRSNKLMLHEDFYTSFMKLPELYNFGKYSRFLDTFGTHYVTEGIMGGTLEYVVIVNKTSMGESKLDSERIGSCFGGSIGLNIPIKKVSLGPKLSADWCQSPGTTSEGKDSRLSSIMDKMILVKGGVAGASSTSLLNNPGIDNHRKWGASLQYNPALIEQEVMPIYELLRFSTASDHVGVRRDNLEQAVDEYLQQFDPCLCIPCRNNGVPVLLGTSCKCICSSYSSGEACEETMRKDIKIDGSWSCWAPWSSCASGRKTRTRTCNNPPPERGGSNCVGSSSQTWHCMI